MDPISFDTYVRRDAYRNGWNNCEPDSEGTGRWLSSTAHEGLLHVFPEGDLFVIVPSYQPIRRVPLSELAASMRELAQTDAPPPDAAPSRTERLQVIEARTAQHIYRAGLEKLWGGRCALTGVCIPDLLRASHAKPWKDCTDAERVDPFNGLLLEVRMDALFDQGYISFENNGKLLISPRLSSEDEQLLGLRSIVQQLKQVAPQHHVYLQWHREHIFRT